MKHVVTICVAAASLATGCARGQTDELFSVTAATTVVARPETALVSVESNRTPEAGWWTWPPPSPVGTPTPVDDTYSLRGDVLFARDQAELAPSAGSQLDAIVRSAQTHPNTSIAVTGYTDSDGSVESNLNLSARRARAVADYLTAAGIDAGRLTIAGRGAADPVAPNDSDEHKAANRRVVVTMSAP